MPEGMVLGIRIENEHALAAMAKVHSTWNSVSTRMAASSARAAKGFNQIQGAIGTLTAPLKMLSLVGGISAGVLIASTAAVGMKYEQVMTDIASYAKETDQTVSQAYNSMSAAAKGWARATTFSALEVSGAMSALSKDGVRVRDINKSVGASLAYAGSMMMDTSEAAGVLIDVMAAFGLQVKDLNRVANVMAATVAKTGVPLELVNELFVQLGPMATDAGMSIEDLAGAFALLEAKGVQGSRAGKGLRMVMDQLIAPSTELKKVIGDVSLATTSWNDMLDILREKITSTTQAYQLFGQAGPLVMKLIEEGSEGFKKYSEAVTGTNTAWDIWKDRMDTVSGVVKQFKNDIQVNMINIMEALKPQIKTVLGSLREEFQKASPYITGAAKAFADYLRDHKDFIGTAVLTVGKVALIGGALMLASQAVVTLSAGFNLLTGVVNIASAAMGIFHTASTGWWGLAIAGVLAMAGSIAVRYSDKVRGFCEDTTKKIQDLMAGTGNFAEKVAAVLDFETMKKDLDAYLEKLKKIGEGVGAMTAPEMGGAPEQKIRFLGIPDMEEVYKSIEEVQKRKAASMEKTKQDTDAANKAIYEKERSLALESVAYRYQYEAQWLEGKQALAESNYQAAIAGAAGADSVITEARLAKEQEIAQACIEYDNARLEHWIQTNQDMMVVAGMVEAAYDTMVESALDMEMTGKKRREAMWESMKQSFLRSTASMLKEALKQKLRNLILEEAAEKPFQFRKKFAEAKIGAVKAYSAFAGIPVVGPILGAIAAAAAFAFLMAFHQGGPVKLRGRETMAVLEEDEYVTKSSSARSLGRANLDYMNTTGRLPVSGSGSTMSPRFEFNISGGGGFDVEGMRNFVDDVIVPQLESAIKRYKFSLSPEVVLR